MFHPVSKSLIGTFRVTMISLPRSTQILETHRQPDSPSHCFPSVLVDPLPSGSWQRLWHRGTPHITKGIKLFHQFETLKFSLTQMKRYGNGRAMGTIQLAMATANGNPGATLKQKTNTSLSEVEHPKSWAANWVHTVLGFRAMCNEDFKIF